MLTNKVFVSRQVRLIESFFSFWQILILNDQSSNVPSPTQFSSAVILLNSIVGSQARPSSFNNDTAALDQSGNDSQIIFVDNSHTISHSNWPSNFDNPIIPSSANQIMPSQDPTSQPHNIKISSPTPLMTSQTIQSQEPTTSHGQVPVSVSVRTSRFQFRK